MSRSVPASRPVHPCLLSVFDGNTGAEFSTWAHITTKKDELPNLVTAQGSTLRIYTIDDASGKLALTYSFTDLAGSVCYLNSLHVRDDSISDSLLIGFAGHPRVAVVSVTAPSSLSAQPIILEATSLIDLTQALIEHSLGSITPLEQDLTATMEQKSSNTATLTVILGGGVAAASIALYFVRGRNGSGWSASEPYMLPLATFQRDSATESAASSTVVSHGLGDITSGCFLSGYSEPTLVLLHSNKEYGRGCSGRLGRPEGEGGTQYGMVVTAISLTVIHKRCAVLWSVEVPADALSLHSVGEKGVLVMSCNTILEISNAGRISPVLSVNGWVQSTCPSSLLEKLQPNPWPLPKLAIQLDGARLSFISEHVALLCLRQGQLYLLQQIGDTWSLMALGTDLASIGQISSLLTLPIANVPKTVVSKLTSMDSYQKEVSEDLLSMGLIFAGSRLGDSTLLGYTLEDNVTFTDKVKQEDGFGKKQKVEQDDDVVNAAMPHAVDEREMILQREEEALYAPTEDDEGPDVIPASSDEEMEEPIQIFSSAIVATKKRSRRRLAKLTVVRSVTTMDVITAPGPIGPGCEGPLSKTFPAQSESINPNLPVPLGATVRIFPCGYGSSGGLSFVTVPGRDDRFILAEADCLNVQCIFSLPSHGLLLLGMKGSGIGGGVSVLRVHNPDSSVKTEEGGPNEGLELAEVDIEEWCTEKKKTRSKKNEFVLESPLSIFQANTLLGAADLGEGGFVVLVKGNDDSEPRYSVVVFQETDEILRTVHDYSILDNVDLGLGSMLSVTPMVSHEQSGAKVVTFGCTWSSGNVTVTTVGASGTFETQTVECTTAAHMIEPDHEVENDQFYESDHIHAVDVFCAPADTFTCETATADVLVSEDVDYDDDAELYEEVSGEANSAELAKSWTAKSVKTASEDDEDGTIGDNLFVAVCRQSGTIQVYAFSKEENATPSLVTSPIWESHGCGLGASVLESSITTQRNPRMHKVFTREMRFFFTGPTHNSEGISSDNFRSFHLIVETSNGDISYYEKCKHSSRFDRVPLRDVARQSREESRHRTKLRRKGILGKTDDEREPFHFNRLHPFSGVSQQDGLFAAISRPVWLMADRGSPVVLYHRSRHVAPAGGNPVPVAGFCAGLQVRISCIECYCCCYLAPNVNLLNRRRYRALLQKRVLSPFTNASVVLEANGLHSFRGK